MHGPQLSAKHSTSVTRILAIDLGKFNSVICDYDLISHRHTFQTVQTTPQAMHDQSGEYRDWHPVGNLELVIRAVGYPLRHQLAWRPPMQRRERADCRAAAVIAELHVEAHGPHEYSHA